MKKKLSIIIGVFALMMAIGLNTRHAMNDYSIKESKYHLIVDARCTYGGCCHNCTNEDVCTDPGCGSGTNAGYCYSNIMKIENNIWQYECDPRTSATKIYPCTSLVQGKANSARDRCTN